MTTIVYFGTPDISASLLKSLIKIPSVKVTHIVTQPDKPVGRKLKITPSAVKTVAGELGIPVLHASDPTLSTVLMEADLAVVFAFGDIIKDGLLALPHNGFWNIHPSLLPLFRGSSPIVYPLMLGETKTGVTLMQMDSLMDHGPIIEQAEVAIDPIESKESLTTKLLETASTILSDMLKDLAQNQRVAVHEQDHERATNTRLIKKEHGFIARETLSKMLTNTPLIEEELPRLVHDYLTRHNIEKEDYITQPSGHILWNYYRALTPWPGIWTLIERDGNEIRLILRELDFIPETSGVQIKTVQVEGRNEISYAAFVEAYGHL